MLTSAAVLDRLCGQEQANVKFRKRVWGFFWIWKKN